MTTTPKGAILPDMEPINQVVEDVKHGFEKLGLYMIDMNVATTDKEAVGALEEGVVKEDFRKKLADGESQWILTGVFTIGDQAFSDRVLNPESEAADTEFRVAVPDEVEIFTTRFKELGMAAFDLDLEDEEEDSE